MSRVPWIQLIACCLLSAGVLAKPPNILVIMADDLGYADMSFLPQSPADVKTPGIDRLAKTGTYFANAYATAPICSPSRAGFITGRYQQRWGNYWYGQGGLPKSEVTLPQVLKPQGYFCQKIGKTHLNGGLAQHPLEHGFDQFLGFIHHTWDYIRLSQEDVDAYEKRAKNLGILNVGPLTRNRDEQVSYDDGFTTEIFTEEAVKTMKRHADTESPFYIQLEHNAVHMPTYIADPDYARKAGYEQPAWDREAEHWKFPFWDPNKMSWAAWHKKWGHLGAVDPIGRKRYIANLMALDDSVGRLLDTLEKTGQRENTMVVFLSDNGGTINTYSDNTPLRGYKYMFGEGGIRIPILVSWPGELPRGLGAMHWFRPWMCFRRSPNYVAAPGMPRSWTEKSLVPILRKGRAAPVHDTLFWDKGKADTWVVRQGPWKLISTKGWIHTNYELDEQGIARSSDAYEYPAGLLLFNLDDDVGETKNLADQHPERVADMRAAYDAWRAKMGKPVRGKKK